MSDHSRRSPVTSVCPTCGGSGALRLGDQSYRTCLDCLGQGRLPNLSPATTTAALLHPLAAGVSREPERVGHQPLRDDVTSAAR